MRSQGSGARTATADATGVAIEGLDAALDIRVGEDPQTTVRLYGDALDVAGVDIIAAPRSLLTLRRRRDTEAAPGRIDAVIVVPQGSAIALRGAAGRAWIGDTHGDLELDLGGSAHVSAGSVASARVRIAGHNRVQIARVHGRQMDIEVCGSGRLCASGSVDLLRARVSGNANVLFLGDARDAALRAGGVSHVNVARVLRDLTCNCSGSGRIIVTHPPR